MPLHLGEIAPDFLAQSTIGPLRFHQWLNGQWGLFFSHPRDFTPVCTTELGALARLQPHFQARRVQLLGLSLDTVHSHEIWAQEIREVHGSPVLFPIVSDLDRSISERYGMIHPELDAQHTVRTVFIIDPQKKIRMTMTYPQSCGRNFSELLRVIDSLQLSDQHPVFTPANWHRGEDVIIAPSLSDANARVQFPEGWHAPKPYLRLTADPRRSSTRQ